MKTKLHLRLEGMCRIQRNGAGHWILGEKHKITRLPVEYGGDMVTTKRAIYAAFVGPVDENEEVYAACGVHACAAPTHLATRVSRRRSRAIGLQAEVDALAQPITYQPAEDPQVLPSGITVPLISMVKQLFRDGATLSSIRLKTGLHAHEIMRIRGGRYDAAVRNLRLSARKAAEAAEARRDPLAAPRRETPTNLSKEDEEWLKSVK